MHDDQKSDRPRNSSVLTAGGRTTGRERAVATPEVPRLRGIPQVRGLQEGVNLVGQVAGRVVEPSCPFSSRAAASRALRGG
jgi:hypothetical protein